MIRHSYCFSALLSCALAAACSPEGAAEGPTGAGGDLVINGRVFEPVDAADVGGPNEAALTGARTGSPPYEGAVEGRQTRPMREWSRDELANALRPRIMHRDGRMYRAREPNWEAADDVLRDDGRTRDVAWKPGAPRPAPEARAAGGLAPQDVFGVDDRTLAPSTTSAPYQSTVRLELYSATGTHRGWCTGEYIGPWTVITSAHCLQQSLAAVDRVVFQPGRQGSSTPYGSFDCRNADASTENDFSWAIPDGYNPTITDNELDYAVIDTWPCHAAPTFRPGYQVNAGNASYSVYGYSSACPGGTANGTVMCGMSGPAYVEGWRMETNYIDTDKGQDGAPWLSDGWKPVAIQEGTRVYHDFARCGFNACIRNFGRRIDGSVDTFIKAWSYDF